MSPREVLRRMRRTFGTLTNEASAATLRLVATMLREEFRRLAQPGVWTAAARTTALRELRRGLARIAAAIAEAVRMHMSKATGAAQRDAADFLRAADLAYLGAARELAFEDPEWLAPRARRLIAARSAGIERSANGYGAELIGAAVAAVGLGLIGRSHAEALDVVSTSVQQKAAILSWRVTRLADTEISAAYNAIHLAAALAEDSPRDPMRKRLIATFDKLTGRDSVLLHGQERGVREPFFDAHFGRSYMAPPNRPHDREIVHAWRASYGALDLGVVDVAGPARSGPPPRPPGRGQRLARNLRAGDVLARAGRPRIAKVIERGDRVTITTDSGAVLYFAAGAAIGVLVAS